MLKYLSVAFVALSALLAGSAMAATAIGTATDTRTTNHPSQPAGWVEESGIASFYGPSFHGRLAADGSRFDQSALTAAHQWLPFGTKVKVTVATTGRTVVVTITDRMPPNRRVVDLSLAAARHLGLIDRGIAKVTLQPA